MTCVTIPTSAASKALAARGVSTYVYKGLGFFESDEVQDGVALLRFLADPQSNLRAAALLRSRLIRLSDAGVAALAPDLGSALTAPVAPAARAPVSPVPGQPTSTTPQRSPKASSYTAAA